MTVQKVERKGLADVYSQLVDIIGIENVQKIHKNFKGQQISFPMRLYSRDYIKNEIFKRYDGTNIKELAKEFDYTERYLRRLIQNELLP